MIWVIVAIAAMFWISHKLAFYQKKQDPSSQIKGFHAPSKLLIDDWAGTSLEEEDEES